MRQSPTATNVWVRSVRDAMLIFNAVANGVAPKVDRRLDENERSLIQSGNVYVWEERGAQIDSTGLSMERWTDGLHWGPSRARDEFLYYQQNIEDSSNPTSKRRRTARNTPLTTAPAAGTSAAGRAGPILTKQTFSANVALPHEQHLSLVRKWHMTAYFAGDHVDELRSVESVPGIGDATLPDGVFTSARSSTRSVSARRNSMTTRPALPPLHPAAPAPVPAIDVKPPPSTPSAESAVRAAREDLPTTSSLGPIPPLPSTATHFPPTAAWDPYAPAALNSSDRSAPAGSITLSRTLSTSASDSSSPVVLLPPPVTVTRGRRPQPIPGPPRATSSAIRVNVLPLPVANTPYGDTVTADNPVIIANRLRPIAADPQNLANVAIAAERPILKLAPLKYLEGLERQRNARDPADVRVLQSFQRARPRRWARSGS